jgi:hypothetical protein
MLPGRNEGMGNYLPEEVEIITKEVIRRGLVTEDLLKAAKARWSTESDSQAIMRLYQNGVLN